MSLNDAYAFANSLAGTLMVAIVVGKHTVMEYGSGDLCQPIVPERLWLVFSVYQYVIWVYGILLDSPGQT